jgi:hypothetical protein
MGYMHINNLYKFQDILLFKQCYAMEKLHGTSTHITWKADQQKVIFFSGGASHMQFIKLFDTDKLKALFMEQYGTEQDVTIYGEAYGGTMQRMADTYGNELKFCAFEVCFGESTFLDVPAAHRVATRFGLDFVDYVLIDSTIENLDYEMMKESTQAIRNGCGPGKKREGIVVRPVKEFLYNNGVRLIAKHKRPDFEPERNNQPKIVDPSKLEILSEANAIADEWVTAGRLQHVCDKIFQNAEPYDMKRIPDVMKAMIEDVVREANNEIVDSKEARKAIGAKTAKLFQQKIQTIKG